MNSYSKEKSPAFTYFIFRDQILFKQRVHHLKQKSQTKRHHKLIYKPITFSFLLFLPVPYIHTFLTLQTSNSTTKSMKERLELGGEEGWGKKRKREQLFETNVKCYHSIQAEYVWSLTCLRGLRGKTRY